MPLYKGILTTLLALFIMLFTKNFHKLHYSIIVDEETRLCGFHLFTLKYRRCIIDRINLLPLEQIWPEWKHIVVECLDGYQSLLGFRFHYNKDEMKLAIIPSKARYQPCIVITLGVGGDILSEQKLQKHAPLCQFHGADPVFEWGKVYKDIGQYYQVAVNDIQAVYNASIKSASGPYKKAAINSTGLIEFLTQNISTSIVDHLWVDNEGPEYRVLPMFLDGMAIEKASIEVCQMNIEMHWPLKHYEMTIGLVGELIRNISTNSAMMPLWINDSGGQRRTYYFNTSSKYCTNKYINDWCPSK